MYPGADLAALQILSRMYRILKLGNAHLTTPPHLWNDWLHAKNGCSWKMYVANGLADKRP